MIEYVNFIEFYDEENILNFSINWINFGKSKIKIFLYGLIKEWNYCYWENESFGMYKCNFLDIFGMILKDRFFVEEKVVINKIVLDFYKEVN